MEEGEVRINNIQGMLKSASLLLTTIETSTNHSHKNKQHETKSFKSK